MVADRTADEIAPVVRLVPATLPSSVPATDATVNGLTRVAAAGRAGNQVTADGPPAAGPGPAHMIDAPFQAALLAAVGQAVIATDPAGSVLFWNPAAERMFGWSAAEAIGRSILELTPTSQTAAQAQEIMAALAVGASWTGDIRVQRRDGTEFPALVTDTPVFDAAGELVAVIGVSTDITERKQAEETAQSLALIVESTADAIITADVAGSILTWNPGAEALYGYCAAEAIGRHIGMLNPDTPEATARSTLSVLATVAAGRTVRDLHAVRRHRDGTGVDVSLTASPLYAEDGTVKAAAVIARDIGDRRRLENELAHLATHDPLTGLPNRVLLDDRLRAALAGADRHPVSVAVMVLDLDQFKTINDTNGHHIGDNLLVQVANRLRANARPTDTVARFGGDEFVIVCESIDLTEAEQIADRFAAALRDPFEIDGHRCYISCSIGIAMTPPLPADASALLRAADAAMYDAKAHGRAQWHVFDEGLAIRSAERLSLATELREALDSDHLELYYQPVIDLRTGALVGLEALLRWEHRLRGSVPPSTFVSLAEHTGVGAALDRWVLFRACRDLAQLRDCGALPPTAHLAVNVSARSLSDPVLVDVVRDAALAAGVPLCTLEIEVTETDLLADAAFTRPVLRALRDLRVGVALDDFGTGYSSLTHLSQLPATTVKIDQRFVQNLVDRPADLAIVTSVVELARNIGMRTIAEGVETQAQLTLLRGLGCELGQGNFWSPARSRDDLAAMLGS